MKIHRLNQNGIIDSWLIAFIITFIIFLGTAGFGLWAFSSMQDYKNNVQTKVDAAVAKAVEENSAKKDAEFAEKEKQPFKTYTGPSAYGSVSLTFPKTWSSYIDESAKGNIAVDGTLNPDYVPGINSGAGVALRLQVLNNQYSNTVRTYESSIKGGKAISKPYKSEKVPSAVGLRIDGEFLPQKKGSLVILPLRDKTLLVWTETDKYLGDFDNIILPNINFVP